MLCSTLDGGVIRRGIQLWQDNPNQCFVHVRPNLWMPVRADLLASTDPAHIERVDGQIILHRASTQVIGNHVVEFIPETPESAGRACVLANIDNRLVQYTEAAPQPDFAFRTAMGLNFCTGQVMGANRVTLNAEKSALACEEYSFVVGMDAGDDVRLQVIFHAADAPHGRQCDPWVEGSFLRFDGTEVTYHPLQARLLSERFRR